MSGRRRPRWRAARRWRRLGHDRAVAASERLDARLDDRADRPVPPGSPFATELRAARALAAAFPLPPPSPPGELVSLRAGLAARRSLRQAGRRRQVSLRIGSAAALALVVALAVLSADPARTPGAPAVQAAEEQASVVLDDLSRRMEEVRVHVEVGDREGTRRTSVAAAGALAQARDTAKLLPPGNPVRDKVLNETLEQIQALQSLVTRLQLEVPPLVAPTPAGTAATSASAAGPPSTSAAAATTATPPSTSAPATSSTTTTSTTSPAPATTVPPVVVVTPPTSPTVTVPAPGTTTTTSTTTTTTTQPATTTTAAPPATTTTTAPAGPPPATTSTTTSATASTSASTTAPQGP